MLQPRLEETLKLLFMILKVSWFHLEIQNALANAILKLLKDPGLADKFGRESKKRATEYFSLNRMVTNMERLYEGLLRKKMCHTEI